MGEEIWFVRYAPIAVPCPECGGKVWFGNDYDWPPDRGGNFLADRCVCEKCKREWTVDDAPKEFSSPDGEMWNIVAQEIADDDINDKGI